MNQALAPLMVLLPLLGAATALILGRRLRAQMAVSTIVLAAVAVIAAVLLAEVDRADAGIVVAVGAWPPPFGIVLVVDRLAGIMIIISALMLLGVLVYAVGQGIADQHRETPVSIFHPAYLILSAGVFNAFLAGDLFNLYVGFEILLGELRAADARRNGRAHPSRRDVHHREPGVVALLPQRDRARLRRDRHREPGAAVGAGRRAPQDIQLMLHLLLLIAFGIKAAVFPLSFWLPDSYPTAPAPVTAVFAGLLTKVGVYAIIRTETVIFPESDLNACSSWSARSRWPSASSARSRRPTSSDCSRSRSSATSAT